MDPFRRKRLQALAAERRRAQRQNQRNETGWWRWRRPTMFMMDGLRTRDVQ